MPVCALVNQKIFCVHGGISSELKSLDQIRNLERRGYYQDVGAFELMLELLKIMMFFWLYMGFNEHTTIVSWIEDKYVVQ